VLKKDGVLVLTTPNGLFWKYLYSIAFYGSWEQYSRYGVYGRHNRLWAPNEVTDILKCNGFEVTAFKRDYAQVKWMSLPTRERFYFSGLVQDIFFVFFSLVACLPIPFFRKKHGDQLYFVARKAAPAAGRCPEYLYSTKFSYDMEK
jgi:hypothetical protein